MGIISRYILRQIAVPALLAVSAIAVVGVSNEIQERISKLPVAQMTLGDIARLALYLLPTLVAFIAPIMYMLGILLAFGRLSQNNEIVAMKAAGIPLRRTILPVIVVGAFLSVLSFFVQDRVQPWAVRKVMDLMYSELPLRVTLDALPAGVMQDYAGWGVYIGKKDLKAGMLEDIVILKPEEAGGASAYYADSAQLMSEGGHTKLFMNNLHLIPPGESGYVTMLSAPTAWLGVPQMPTDRPPRTRRECSLDELMAKEGALKDTFETTQSESSRTELSNYRIEIAGRLSLPFACLAVTLAAAPLGARARRAGRPYTFAVGFAIILVYYVLTVMTEPKSLSPLWLMISISWIPNVALGLAGIGLIWKVDRV
jgi:lipopolysaccharide export system permease protein